MHERGAGARSRIGALAAGLAAGVTVLAWTSCCPVADAAQIAAGGSSACMIAAGGHVECWGANESGQLGNGTTVRSATPVEVQDVTGARDIGVGEGHSCAVLSTGHVECWGSNRDGALGNGGHGSYSEVPVEVSGIADAVQIAVGFNHTCVVLSSGRVDCWGAKVIEAIDSPSYTPVEVPGIHDATEAAVGRSHS